MTPLEFETSEALSDWLALHGRTETEAWVRMFRKGTRRTSVDWQGIVAACLAHGWIDGLKRPYDEVSSLQRITPRRPKGTWSKKNRDTAERLIAEGRMTPEGLAHVEAAKADGRWDAAYAGQADMVIPEDFLAALEDRPVAKAFYGTLNRANLFAIYHRLTTAKKPATRAARMQRILDQLDREETFH